MKRIKIFWSDGTNQTMDVRGFKNRREDYELWDGESTSYIPKSAVFMTTSKISSAAALSEGLTTDLPTCND